MNSEGHKISESKDVNNASSEEAQGDSDNVAAQPIKVEEAIPPPTQVTLTADKNAKETEDKVRAILEQPKMTPEEREKKKQELIQRQKEARQRAGGMTLKGGPSTPKPAVAEPRENLISQATKFLSSPSLINADEEKKLQFLLSKGMTRKEIDIAKERVGVMPAPPVVPPRTYPIHAPTIVHAPPMATVRAPMWKKLIYVLLFTGAFSALMITAIKKLLGPMVTAVISAKQQLYSHQLSLFRRFNEKLSSFVTLLEKEHVRSSRGDKINELDGDEDNEPTISEYEDSVPPSLLAPLSTDLANLSERIYTHQQNVLKNEAMEDLQRSLTSLTTYLSTNMFLFTSWSTDNEYNGDVTVEQVKNEIRSIKGSLIGRSNFPKIPVTPSSSTPLYSSKKFQSTPKQQILEPVAVNDEIL